MPDIEYRTTASELTSIADAIREKGGTSESLIYPSGFINATENIQSGGILCIFTVAPYTTTEVVVNGQIAGPVVAYYGVNITAGATITFKTYGDYILDTVTGVNSGNTISFTTVTRGTYTFTMPSESVYCSLLYDD